MLNAHIAIATKKQFYQLSIQLSQRVHFKPSQTYSNNVQSNPSNRNQSVAFAKPLHRASSVQSVSSSSNNRAPVDRWPPHHTQPLNHDAIYYFAIICRHFRTRSLWWCHTIDGNLLIIAFNCNRPGHELQCTLLSLLPVGIQVCFGFNNRSMHGTAAPTTTTTTTALRLCLRDLCAKQLLYRRRRRGRRCRLHRVDILYI